MIVDPFLYNTEYLPKEERAIVWENYFGTVRPSTVGRYILKNPGQPFTLRKDGVEYHYRAFASESEADNDK